jgi:DNA-binding MarR family transcriptional regulator
MKLFEKATIRSETGRTAPPASTESIGAQSMTAESVSALLVDVIPMVMRSIRANMRGSRAPDLSVPQLRTLTFLSARPGAHLSEVAEHVGIGLPSMSKLVDALVERGLVSRQNARHDRRRVVLLLTGDGAALLDTARRGTIALVAERLQGLSGDNLAVIATAMASLRAAFSLGRESNEE